jgi:tRNA wybutosine-synthesizing protein 1
LTPSPTDLQNFPRPFPPCLRQPGAAASAPPAPAAVGAVRILYGSTKGTCKHLATELANRLTQALPPSAAASPATVTAAATAGNGCGSATCCRTANGPASAPGPTTAACCVSSSDGASQEPAVPVRYSATDLASFEPEQLLGEPAESLVVVVISTYEGGTPPESARFFCRQVHRSNVPSRSAFPALSTISPTPVQIARSV